MPNHNTGCSSNFKSLFRNSLICLSNFPDYSCFGGVNFKLTGNVPEGLTMGVFMVAKKILGRSFQNTPEDQNRLENQKMYTSRK